MPKRLKRVTTRLLEAKNKARSEGWLKYLRQGDGEEADERALLAGCRFSVRRRDHWLNFGDKYGTLTEGAFKGKKFELADWQVEDTGRFFGWLVWHPEWNCWVRRFRFFYLEVPKKNGKTPLLSLIGNYLLFGDSWNRQINLYLTATTRKQAERCLLHAVRQVNAAPALAAMAAVKKLEGFYQIEYGDNVWNVAAADPNSIDGVNGHCLADELHRWVGFEFFNTLKFMIAAQPEGVFAGITTAGDNHESVCRQLHDKTKAVNSGRVEDQQFLGRIYAADPEDDPHKEETWRKANPSLGTDAKSPLKLSTFRADYQAAKEEPWNWASFLRLRLGIWQTATNGWLDKAAPRGIADWDSGPTDRKKVKSRIDCFEAYTMDEAAAMGWTAVAGLDFASVRDTNACSITLTSDSEEVVRTLTWFWLPEAEAARQNKVVPYQRWAADGWIKLTPGEVVDYDTVFADVKAIFQQFGVTKFYYDPLFQAEWLCQSLENDTGAERVAFPPTIVEFGPIVKECERLLIKHQLRHNGNPVMTWQMGNAQAYQNANGDKRLIKQKAGDWKKVDGPQSLLMSMRDITLAESQGSFYDDNDVEEI